MPRLTPADEYLHLDYPKVLRRAWKENYYFNFIDVPAGVWGINHFSISRHTGTATFRAFHYVDGQVRQHVSSIPWRDGTVVGDEKLRLEIVNPFEKQRVVFDDGGYSVDLVFTPRFDVFDYNAHGPKNALSSESNVFDTEHYEQGMYVSGVATIGCEERLIHCLGHRDHSWGFRDEAGVLGWNWVAAQFESATVNFFYLRGGSGNLEKGFISRVGGNEAVSSVRVLDVQKGEDGSPCASRYRITTHSGQVMTFGTTCFAPLRIPLGEAGRVVVMEGFSDFAWEETGERGLGIDEHMIVG